MIWGVHAIDRVHRAPTTMARTVLTYGHWSILLFCGLVSQPLNAQNNTGEEPPAFTAALVMLAMGDTVGAIGKLREAVEDAPDFGPAYLRLGSVLSARAGEIESGHAERRQADKALNEAWRLMGDDPEVLLELGLLLRRQQLKGDAERVLNRAWRAAEQRRDEMSPERLAELHYALGRVYESWWDDWRKLVMIPRSAEVVSCPGIRQPEREHPEKGEIHVFVQHSDASVLCPERWAEQLDGLVMLADLKSSERERMIAHFRLAFEADSTRTDAAFRLLGHLADAEEWDEYLLLARAVVALQPDDARSHLFLGLGLHETGAATHAEKSFATALRLLPNEEQAVFEDITPLLSRKGKDVYAGLDSAARVEAKRMFFTSSDPLLLTEAQERRLEHYSRVAWAELRFGDPATGQRGWDSERGRIWIRYGRPWREYQCCYGGFLTKDAEGGRLVQGRHEYWGYGPQGPVFVFERNLTYRDARMIDVAKFQADELAIDAPELYRPRMITEVHEYPHQLARFRGSEPAFTRVEVFAAPPVSLLDADPGSSLETGAFLFDGSYRELWARRLTVPVGERPVALSYEVEVPAGAYNYALEARRESDENEPRPLARMRDSLTVTGFPAGQLSISDILLADAIRPLSDRPTRREELRIWPNRTLRVGSDQSISIYFEIYGLQTDRDGLARYRVELAVEDAEQRNLVERIARGVTEVFRRGGQREPEVSWERVVELAADRSMEYVTVDLRSLEPGDRRVRVRIADLVAGTTATSERQFVVEE